MEIDAVIIRFRTVVFLIHSFYGLTEYSWRSWFTKSPISPLTSFAKRFDRDCTNFMHWRLRVSVSDSSRSFLIYYSGSISYSSRSSSVIEMFGTIRRVKSWSIIPLKNSTRSGKVDISLRYLMTTWTSFSFCFEALTCPLSTICQIF